LYFEIVIGESFPFLEGKISGTVTDASTGQPIDNSMVIVGLCSLVNQTVATNSTGQYYIGNLQGNLTGITYNVTASKTGYLTSSKNVTLTTEIDYLPPATQNFVLIQIANVTPTSTVPELSAETFLFAFAALTVLSGLVFKKRRKFKL